MVDEYVFETHLNESTSQFYNISYRSFVPFIGVFIRKLDQFVYNTSALIVMGTSNIDSSNTVVTSITHVNRYNPFLFTRMVDSD